MSAFRSKDWRRWLSGEQETRPHSPWVPPARSEGELLQNISRVSSGVVANLHPPCLVVSWTLSLPSCPGPRLLLKALGDSRG